MNCKLLWITIHISTKATPAGASWIYVPSSPLLSFSTTLQSKASLADLPTSAMNAAYMHCTHIFLVSASPKKARTMHHVQNSYFIVSRTTKNESRKVPRGSPAICSRQCATCIKYIKRNITIIMMPPSRPFLVSSRQYFRLLRHCCELLRDFRAFGIPSNTPIWWAEQKEEDSRHFRKMMIMIMVPLGRMMTVLLHFFIVLHLVDI